MSKGSKESNANNIADILQNLGAMQGTLNLSTSFVDSMRKISAQRNEIAKAALKIPNYSQIVSLVLNELSAEHLSLNETVKTLSALGAPLESAITPDADDEIEYEDNEFTKYWFAIYEHIIKAYNVVNSSLVGTALRDLISILSLIITMQGGTSPAN